ncbi:MAG TPA: hypothetical protein VH720_14035 [Candidatus Limnocylindrales bacterium]|jgi:hypothetical protein
MAVFDWWLLIVGVLVGAGLVWLVLADSARREADVLEEELPVEAAWLSAALEDEGRHVDQPTAERLLRLHRVYLASLPPDEEPTAESGSTIAESSSPPAAPADDAPVRDEVRPHRAND